MSERFILWKDEWKDAPETLPIELTGLSNRTQKRLTEAGLDAIGELRNWSPDELLALPGFGEGCLAECFRTLARYGFNLRVGAGDAPGKNAPSPISLSDTQKRLRERREKVLALIGEGKTMPQIAELVGVETSKVVGWMRNHNVAAQLGERLCTGCKQPFQPNRIDQKCCQRGCRGEAVSAASAARSAAREARQNAVLEMLAAGKPMNEIAETYGVSRQAVDNWVKDADVASVLGERVCTVCRRVFQPTHTGHKRCKRNCRPEKLSPEERSARSREAFARPEVRAKFETAFRSEEYRAKHSANAKARWQDPAYRAKNTQTPERRKRQSEVMHAKYVLGLIKPHKGARPPKPKPTPNPERSERTRSQWQDPVFRARQMEARGKNRRAQTNRTGLIEAQKLQGPSPAPEDAPLNNHGQLALDF